MSDGMTEAFKTTKALHELTLEEYVDLIASGMMYVYYPECTGSYSKDSVKPNEKEEGC